MAIEENDLNGKNEAIEGLWIYIIVAPIFGFVIYMLLEAFVGGIFRESWNWGIFIGISIAVYPLLAYGHYWLVKRWHTCPKCKEPFALAVESYETLTRKVRIDKDGNSFIAGKRKFFFICTKCGEHCSKTRRYEDKM